MFNHCFPNPNSFIITFTVPYLIYVSILEKSILINLYWSLVNMSRQIKILENLPGNRLPTTLQILQRYECIRKSDCTSKATEIYELLVQEVLAIWNKAYIPSMEKRNIKRKLENIGKKYTTSKRLKKI